MIANFLRQVKNKILLLFYNLLEFFDKSPLQKNNEDIEKYLFRIDKKYALRYLNFWISLMPDYNSSILSDLIEKEKNEDKKELFNMMLDAEAKKIKLIILKKKILEKKLTSVEKKALITIKKRFETRN
ncbi:MAG: hypothetical protein COU63_02925 [Candidatus Pacebacteria bacterium CG10_big_fil_rev_8_21_14_0_10_36_11]|nr:hypothetical protein [Candidatus Pacearchaeota archaeon]OIP74383.1 MAG: hypothetical protein AUK08_01185 [Candidatus Pacebacteria bacterium CG2_30_36_39]PIR64946.1 MAG: hypothetical protein COU63_02925 [Candidatus Pacebacteria bacterium CG10_big_fil_rev_8_21_14_0_10_36_11]PJC43036.1 MAG: hypothetical protein CO040_01305 [Candidatus Pacebacteria bacterium CG_4_9_14_0_2_um_filter_36_8]